MLIAIGIAAFDAGDAGDAGEDEEDISLHGSECDIYIFISFRVQHGCERRKQNNLRCQDKRRGRHETAVS